MRTCVVICLTVFHLAVLAQNPGAGAGNGLEFDGVDDYVEVTGGTNQSYGLPFSITAWIKIDPTATGTIPIFSSNDQNNSNVGLHFWLTDTSINAGYCNGMTGAFLPNTFYRQYISNNLKGIWIHVGAVINTNSISLFLNGIQLGGQQFNTSVSYSPSTSGTSVIGRKTNGTNTAYFKGEMDEVILWDGSLTPVDIRNNMCKKLSPVPPNIFRYLRLDQLIGTSLIDNSPLATNAQAVNGPVLVKSGAALGDASTYTYQNGSWAGYTHSFGSLGGNNFAVSNVQGNPDGLQMYLVESLPNNLNTIDWICAEESYVGVFICRQSTQNYTYSFDFNFNGNTAVNSFIPSAADIGLNTRNDNSLNWQNVVLAAPPNRTFSLQQEITRKEYALSGVHIAPVFNLPDTISCADSIIMSVPNNPVYFYNWSNGGMTNQSTYTQSGQHWVEYGDTCGNSVVQDTFQITLGFSDLSIGRDTVLCFPDSLVLSTNLNFANHLWQDGSTGSTFKVTQPGTYWVEVDFGPCFGSDTIFVDYEFVQSFSLGTDTSFCFGDSVFLDASPSGSSNFLWNTGETSSGIWVSQTGNYSVVAGARGCFETESINVEVALDDIEVARDTLICNGQVAVLWATGGDTYEWSNGSTNDTIIVSPNSTTTYSVKINEDACSTELNIQVSVTDRIAISDFDYAINACDNSVSFTNLSINADNFLWEFGDGETSTVDNPAHQYDEGGTFLVKLVASKNSCPDTSERLIEIMSLKNIIFFAEAFTPNSDGVNDLLEIKGSANCFINPVFIVQNRWGNEVFRTDEPFKEFWDGTLDNTEAPKGVYFYSFYSNTYITQGQFTLYR